MRDRNLGRILILSGLLALGTAAPARGDVAYSDIWNNVLTQCVGCHNDPQQNGGMRFGDIQSFHSITVNRATTRTRTGKFLRVHPYAPELSFLVDKLRGHVKAGEGDPMLRGGPGLVYFAPGYLAAIEEWIRAGAPNCTGAKGSPTCPTFLQGSLQAGKPQPAFTPEAPAGATISVAGESFTVSHLSMAPTITREGTHESAAVPAGNPAPTMVSALSIQASAGTEWVALYRGEEDVPVAVARGERLDVALPEGVGLPIDTDQSFRIVQHARNDYFLPPGDPANPEPPGLYHNQTTGNVAVYLTTDDTATVAATPFADTTGTNVLFVPPQRVGVTGGAWPGPGGGSVSGATVGVWADRRAIAAALIDPASQQALTETGQAEDEPELLAGYVDAAGTAPIAYSCVHNNGATNVPDGQLAFTTTLTNDESLAASFRPVRAACTPPSLVPVSALAVPSGLPAVIADALGVSDQACWRDHVPSPDPGGPTPHRGSDCESPEACRPANLVAGPSLDDGRCALVGLWW